MPPLGWRFRKDSIFLTFGEEFCAGLVVREKDIVLSFGSHSDSRCYIATLGRDDVAALFAPSG
jgi:hypothetical protein